MKGGLLDARGAWEAKNTATLGAPRLCTGLLLCILALVSGFGCRVSGLGFRVSGLGFGVWGSGFGVRG